MNVAIRPASLFLSLRSALFEVRILPRLFFGAGISFRRNPAAAEWNGPKRANGTGRRRLLEQLIWDTKALLEPRNEPAGARSGPNTS